MSFGADKSEDEQLQSEEGLKQIVDLLKYTIALATGSLSSVLAFSQEI